jgi:hypothetical protein
MGQLYGALVQYGVPANSLSSAAVFHSEVIFQRLKTG